MSDELVIKSARVIPMLSSDWQANLNPEDASQNPDQFLFRWDGKFIANRKIKGTWKMIAEVEQISDFDPEDKNQKARRPAFTTITFKDDGKTDSPTHVWSGDTLMDIDKYQALKLKNQSIDGTEYLFLEAGGFSNRHKTDWKTKWYVLSQ